MTLSTASQDQTSDSDADEGRSPAAPNVPHRVFVYDLDDTTYEYEHPTITGAQIMAAGGIPVTEGIIQILPDGTRETVAPDATIHLAAGAQFKRRPRFKRG